MFVYEKKLQYPVNIKQTNAKLAKIIITQYGGAYSKIYKKQAVRYKSAYDRRSIEFFTRYVDVITKRYKDKVKLWLTFNEIDSILSPLR